MRWWLAVVGVAACTAMFTTKRPKPPDVWAIKAATIHSMMTPAAAFASDTPECKAAPTPDLELFCQHKCDGIGEMSLKAYCAWDCAEVKNPDLRYLCTLERNREKQEPTAAQCDAINEKALREHCKAWIVATGPKRKP